MRLFAAVPLPPPAREPVVALLARLRATGWPVRWVSEENLHVTLKFYGEVRPERLDVIEESVRFAVADTGPLALTLGELGGFPTTRRPRVLWLGIDAPPALELLQDRLERFGEQIGFPPEGAPFRPHLTLGRVREGNRLPVDALEAHQGAIPPVPFLAEEVVLFESVLQGGGPEYTARTTLALAP